MADIFQEVDEDMRREEYARLWKRYGALIIAGCFALVLVSAGMVIWRNYRSHVRQAASLKYEAIVHAGEDNQKPLSVDDAKRLAAIEPSLTAGYRVLAEFERAGALVRDKSYAQAIQLFDTLAKDGAVPSELRVIAALKSAYLQAESLSLADMRARLQAFAAPESAFRFSADELLAYVALRTGDLKAARDYYDAILSDPAAPDGVRQRSQYMAGLVAGKLPPEAPPAPKSASPAPAKRPSANH